MNKPNIMIVDDEQAILDALYRLFRKDYQVHCFLEAELALQALIKDEFSVVISDMKMPNMTGDIFLKHAYESCPQTTRILLTGYADIDSAARAINLGKVSNYVNKPWDNKALKKLIEQGVEQHQLSSALGCIEKKLVDTNESLKDSNACLKEQLGDGSIKIKSLSKQVSNLRQQQRVMMQDVLTMMNTLSAQHDNADYSHVQRVAGHCRQLANYMNLSKSTASHSYLVGLLHEIGKVMISDKVLLKHENDLTKEELAERRIHVHKGAEILSALPQLKEVAIGVKHQYEAYNGTGYPDHLKAHDIPISARILSVVNDFDKYLLGITTGKKHCFEQAKTLIEKQAGRRYDPVVVSAYFELLATAKDQVGEEFEMCISIDMLESGMVLSRDLTNKQDAIMLTKDTEITEQIIGRLKQYEEDWQYIFNIFVV